MSEQLEALKRAEAEAALQAARAAFRELAAGLGDEALVGAADVVRWIAEHKGAGYRRLCQFLVSGGRQALAQAAAGEV